MKINYHTALKDNAKDCEKVSYVTFPDGSIAFHHNVAYQFGLPIEYNSCDVLYTETAWKAGIEKFNARAEDDTSYMQYLEGLSQIAMSNRKPMVIVAGATEGKYLPDPTMMFDTKLNGGRAIAYVYGMLIKPITNSEHLIAFLSKRFNRVGDFCCGYGRTGMIFKEAGKTFVMSDYNAKCIGYIKENFDYGKAGN